MPNDSETKENDNLRAILVGLFLIILVAVITVLKTNSEKNNTSKKSAELSSVEKTDFAKSNTVTAEELAKKIQLNSDLMLIDLRNEMEYQAEHIIDSINIPSSELTSFSTLIAKNKALILVDDLGNAATINSAVNVLSSKGYENISYLEGGFDAWKNKVNPTISDGNQESFTDQAKVKYISSDELKKQLTSESEKFLIIDVRNSASFHAGHLPGAVNISLGDLEAKRKNLSSRGKIILSDDSGVGAFKGSVRLFDLGFFNVLALSDGLDGWRTKGFELEK